MRVGEISYSGIFYTVSYFTQPKKITDCLSIRSTVNLCVGSVFTNITTTKLQRNCQCYIGPISEIK